MNFDVDHPIILTPSARLARSLQLQHAKKNAAIASSSWRTLNVRTLAQWLDETITNAILIGEVAVHLAPEKCLTPLEERLLWQEVIAKQLRAQEFSQLFDLSGLADVCMEANRYAVAWRLPLKQTPFISQETKFFLEAQQLFQARCRVLNVLENVRYVDWQISQLEQTIQTLPSVICFAGFDQTAPQEAHLRLVLQKKQCQVETLAIGEKVADEVSQLAFTEQHDELRSAVAWARKLRLENPQAKLAIVVPQLAELRNRLADLLDDVLAPKSVRPARAETARIYNFSLGLPLAQQPLVKIALHLLTLFSQHRITQAALSVALLSPDWSAGQTEADDRARLEASMRDALAQNTHWHNVMRFFKQQSAHLRIDCLLRDCEAAHQLMQHQPRKQSPSSWATVFTQLLQTLQWPGERSESSHAYQARLAWEKALQQLARLDFLGQSYTAISATSLLQKICEEQVFQPETEGESSIQLMGMLEALSAPVDAMWVMGMNDTVWPPPARPNPLLPAEMQRAAKVSNADSLVQTAFAMTIHQRLLHSAKKIIFSYSLKEGEKILRVSPVLQGIATCSEELFSANTLAESLAEQATHEMEFLLDTHAPPVAEGEHVRGGTSLMRAQAICPAWAFFQFRLGAKKLRTPQNGLDAAQRGQLVHLGLEQFWRQENHYRHFADLARMNEAELQMAVAEATKNAMQIFAAQQKENFSESILQLEAARLENLLNGWCSFERERAETFTMHACEAEKKVNIHGIEVTLKIDRIHRIDNGGLVLVDYKTGQLPSMKSWGEDRITEPQLPIYALFFAMDDEHIAGIQFGKVKTADFDFAGLLEAQFLDEIEKRKPEWIRAFADWATLKEHWKTAIENIVREIQSGYAAVIFNHENDLTYCDVLPILRLPERQLQFERQIKSGQ
jgi:exodeoxyribonuclease-5